MSLPKTLDRFAAGAENIWPPRVAGLRSMTEEEADRLASALDKPVDREHLEHWVTTAIPDAVKLSNLPSPRQARGGLKKLASEGRRWVAQVDSDPIKALLYRRYCRKIMVYRRLSQNIRQRYTT
jgi:hypothetical protein